MDLAVLSNNTWEGYCGGHGRTANQITHSPTDKNGGGDDKRVYVRDNNDVGEKDERVGPPIVVHKRLKFALFGLFIVNTKPHEWEGWKMSVGYIPCF